MPLYSQLVCLVGENPLPVYLSIKQLAEPDAQITLVYTKRTEDYVENISKTLKGNGFGNAEIVPYLLDNPYQPLRVKAVASDLATPSRQIGLNYTGGTKVMSAFSVLAWQHALADAFYLEEEGGKFQFGTGKSVDLELELTLQELYSLYGVKPEDAKNYDSLCTPQDLIHLFKAYSHGLPKEIKGLASKKDFVRYVSVVDQYDAHAGSWKPKSAMSEFVNKLTQETADKWQSVNIPKKYIADTNEKTTSDHYALRKPNRFYEQCNSLLCYQVEFVTGGWLEQLMRILLLSIPVKGQVNFGERIISEKDTPLDNKYLFNINNITSGQEFTIAGQLFESDLLAVYRQRLRYISVTTSNSAATCKGKMFEAIYRAGQIGGGLASASVVCLMDDNYVQDCQKSIGENSPNRFFGRKDLIAWLINHDAYSLRNFLTKNTHPSHHKKH